MVAPHWTKIVFYLFVLPALAFWLITRLFHIHDPGAQEIIAGIVGFAAIGVAVRQLS